MDTGSRRHTVIEVASGMGHRQEDVQRSSCQSGKQRRVIFSSLCLLAGSVHACEDEIQSSSFHSLLFSPVCISMAAAQTIIFLSSTLTTDSSLSLAHILRPFNFLATSIECVKKKKKIFQFHFASPRLKFSD